MAKGGDYERELCRKISLWWSKGIRDDLFWRTAGSGGRATSRGKKGKTTANHCGDICSTDSSSEPLIRLVTIESKRGYSRSTIADLLDSPENSALQKYEEWFEQAETSRKNSDSYSWLLIVKRDRRNPIVFMPFLEMYQELLGIGVDLGTCLPLLKINVNLRDSQKNTEPELIIGMRLEDFLSRTEPSQILSLLDRLKGRKAANDVITSSG